MKHDLRDTTFLILVQLDTVQRLENLLAVTDFLISHFNTTINVLEVSTYNNKIVERLLNRKINYSFTEDHDPILHRTKYLNHMLFSTKTPFVSVWDADVLTGVEQILETINMLRCNMADCIYPYTNKFLDTTTIIRKLYLQKKQIKILYDHKDKMKEMYPPKPVGGAFFCRLDSYFKIGLENEMFYGWGIEDGERYLRWEKSNFKIERVKGPLFHLSHPRGVNSEFHHPDQSFIKLKILETSAKSNI